MTLTSYVRPMSTTISCSKSGIQNAYRSSTRKWNDSFTGSEDPKWREKIQNRLDATGPLTATRSSITIRNGALRAEYSQKTSPKVKSGEDVWSGWIVDPDKYGWPSLPTGTYNSAATTVATTRFNAKLAEVVSPVKGMTFVGELRETIQMIKGRASFLLQDVGKYAKKARKLYSQYPGRRATKDVGNLWLEYNFGWAPLVSDIESGISALNQDRLKVVPITGRAAIPTAVVSAGLVEIGSQSCYAAMMTTRTSGKSSCWVRGVVDLSLITPIAEANVSLASADRWGFTAREFIPTMWELAPYSFLVDYFVNVGDVINSVFAEKRALRWSNRTTKATFTQEVYLGWPKWTAYGTAIGRFPYSPIIYTPCGSTSMVERIDRVSSPSLFVPFVIQYPSFGSAKWGNMAALLTQLVNV